MLIMTAHAKALQRWRNLKLFTESLEAWDEPCKIVHVNLQVQKLWLAEQLLRDKAQDVNLVNRFVKIFEVTKKINILEDSGQSVGWICKFVF